MAHADGAFGGAPAGAAGAAPPAAAAGDADDVTPGEKSWHYVCELAATAYPGDDPWKELHKALETATSSAPDMLNYHDFLEKIIGEATPPLPKDVGECKRAIPVIPFDLGRAGALRCVTPSSLKQKARDLTVAQQWRSYDKATFSYLNDDSLFFEDGHIRYTAFHGVLYIFYRLGRPVPEYVRRMAADIDVVISRKGVTRKDAITSAIAISASLTYGVVPLSWLDIILHVNEHRGDENYADDLSGLVQAACPEYAKKITNWKHLKNIATRLASRTIHALEREMIRHGLPFHILPISWFREAWILTAPDEDAPPPREKNSAWVGRATLPSSSLKRSRFWR